MREISKHLLMVIVTLGITYSQSFAVYRETKTSDGDCNSSYKNKRYQYILKIDTNDDGKFDKVQTMWCNGAFTEGDIIPPTGTLSSSHYGLINLDESRVDLGLNFEFTTFSPNGVKEIRNVVIWTDSAAGDIGIEYGSIEKNNSGRYKSFIAPLQVLNPNNNGWTFADVHGVPFFDTVRGTMVNELYENVTNALVGIQYFPNGGDAITFFFYPKN